MKNFINFIRDEKRNLCIYVIRIMIVAPILVLAIMIFSLWFMLKLKGGDLPVDKLMELIPTMVELACVGVAGILIHMVINQWQKYIGDKDDC
ncbi:hypothetical protein RO07_11775 [Pandoraea pulmonicola]|uniref:Uncharacterized protein n=2 Tax=Pandoraea pulmonicola TaxID=93221 RepID=A0ABN4EPK2_PANPU|nr:hypothetical protein RO07_11775 [Pandoraea pulmonicola]